MKSKRWVSMLLCMLLCVSVFVGCTNKKYDVTMKVVCRELIDDSYYGGVVEEWIFTPDIEEMHTEREYDGKEYVYSVYQYNLPDHPRWSRKWLSPSGKNGFVSSLGKVNQRYDEKDPQSVCERGEYVYHCTADRTSDLWNYRTIRLYITVT